MNGVLLVLTDLPQVLATQQSLRVTAGDCVFAVATRRKLLRVVPATEDYEEAWLVARDQVSRERGPYTSVLAVAMQDRRASEILALR